MGYWSATNGWTTYFDRNGNLMLRSNSSNTNRLQWGGTKLAGYDGNDNEQCGGLTSNGRRPGRRRQRGTLRRRPCHQDAPG